MFTKMLGNAVRGVATSAFVATLSLLPTHDADAQVTSAEVIFVVDESGSMSGEHNFIGGFVTSLDARLNAGGITGSYGLVGFGGGGAGNLGRTINVGGMLLGSAPDFNTATGSLVLTGSFEDGFSGINFANNTYPDVPPNVRRTLVLVTDEDRDNGNGALTAASIVADLNARGISLVSVINGDIRGSMNEIALATDGTNAFVQNGTGFVTVPLGSTSGAGTTDADYIQTALQTPNGCVADLNQLRAGGDTATAFAEIFAQCLLFSITGLPSAPPPTGANLFLNVYVNSLDVVQDGIEDQLGQIVEIDLGSAVVQEALASASNNTQIVNDILSVSGLRAYLIVNLQTGEFEAFGNNKGFDYSGGGTMFGADYSQTNAFGMGETTTFGGALAYHTLNNSVSFPVATGAGGSLDTDVYSGELYAMVKMPEGVYAKATAQASLANYEQRRTQGTTLFRASTNGVGLKGDIEVGYDLEEFKPTSDPNFGVNLTPFASFGIDYRSVDGFQEDNGGVIVADFTQTSVIATVGGRATMTYKMGLDTAFLSTQVAGLFDLLDDDNLVQINNGTFPSERIEAVDDIQLRVTTTAGLKIAEDGAIFVSYGGGFSSNAISHAVSLGGTIPF